MVTNDPQEKINTFFEIIQSHDLGFFDLEWKEYKAIKSFIDARGNEQMIKSRDYKICEDVLERFEAEAIGKR